MGRNVKFRLTPLHSELSSCRAGTQGSAPFIGQCFSLAHSLYLCAIRLMCTADLDTPPSTSKTREALMVMPYINERTLSRLAFTRTSLLLCSSPNTYNNDNTIRLIYILRSLRSDHFAFSPPLPRRFFPITPLCPTQAQQTEKTSRESSAYTKLKKDAAWCAVPPITQQQQKRVFQCLPQSVCQRPHTPSTLYSP